MASDLFFSVVITAKQARYDLSPDLTSFTIEEEGTKSDVLTIRMSDPDKVFSHALQEGMAVEVDLGRIDDHSLIFRGQIYKVTGEFPQDGVPNLRILAYDNSMRMGLKKRSRPPWTGSSLQDIVEEVARAYFSDVTVNLRGNPVFNGGGIRQQDQTDLDFLRGLATGHGCELFVVAGEQEDAFHFVAQYHLMTVEPAVTLYHGRCDVPGRLLSFEANAEVGDIQLPRAFSGIDYDTGERIEVPTAEVEVVGNVEDAFFDESLAAFREREPEKAAQLEQLLTAAPQVQEELRTQMGSVSREATPGFTSREALQERASNQFSTSIHGMRASGTTPGNHRLHAQSTVRIADVGGRFSETWYLSQVRHILDAQGYRTEFECQR